MAPNGIVDGLSKPHYQSDLQKEAMGALSGDKAISKRQPLKWGNIVAISLLHVFGVWGLTVIPLARPISVAFCTFYGILGGYGVTAGAHRLWAHRTYKAKVPFRIILAILFSVAGQNTIPQWVKDHRVHHKFSETDADPHNSHRGFFFAHVGWLMQLKHPQVLLKGKSVDMSDIYEDPVVQFHTKYFLQFKFFFSFILPIIIPYYLLNETFYVCFFGNCLRYVFSLNATWLVNSAAHIYGNRPYSTQIRPAENKVVSFLALGEGWHNYHHVFPWDYRAAELGGIVFNPTTVLLDTMAYFGVVTDRKAPSRELVLKMAQKYGDGSYKGSGRDENHIIPEVDEYGREVLSN